MVKQDEKKLAHLRVPKQIKAANAKMLKVKNAPKRAVNADK